MAEKKKPGPNPELFKVDLPFEKAVQAAMETKVPQVRPKKRKRRKPTA